MRKRLAGLCGLLLLAGCSAGAAGGAGANDAPRTPAATSTASVPSRLPFAVGGTDTATLDGQRVRLDYPLTRELVGVAVYFHGAGAGADSKMNEPWLNSIRALGWAVAAGDLHGDAWGARAAVADSVALVDWAEARTGADVKLLIGASMGGVASLNALMDGVVEAPCWFGPQPVVDLNAVSVVPNADAQIAALYGGPPPASSNPVDRLDLLPLDTRYRVIFSAGDTWVPPPAHADRLIAALQARGGDVSSVAVSGDHLDASHFRPEDLVAFAEGCA